jgi:hypothetical protein
MLVTFSLVCRPEIRNSGAGGENGAEDSLHAVDWEESLQHSNVPNDLSS